MAKKLVYDPLLKKMVTRKEFLIAMGAALVALVPIVEIIKKLESSLSSASGPYTSAEAESGVLGGGAALAADSSASGGEYVKFNAPAPAPTPTPITTGGGGSAGFGQAVMAPPRTSNKTYSVSDIVFEDKFQGSSLDLTKWWPRIGAQGSVWNNRGNLACPYSGANTPLGQNGQFEGQLGDPSQISVNDGMTLTVRPLPSSAPFNSSPYNQYLALGVEMTSYNVAGSDCTGSTAKNTLPNTGWYVQINEKLPDMQHGVMGGNLWFLEPLSGAPEIDLVQPGFGIQNGASGSAINQYPFGIGYLNGANGGNQAIPNVGVDVTQNFHTYGIEWIPGVSLSCYFDGKQVYSKTSSQVGGGGLVRGNYEIIIEAAVWVPGLGFTTGYNGSTAQGQIAEIQAYKY